MRCTYKNSQGGRCVNSCDEMRENCGGHTFIVESDGFQTVHSTKPVSDGPAYYKGLGGLEARDVVASFQLGYNVGTSVVYCLRAGKKPGNTFVADIEKAIHHLKFALEDAKRKA